MSHGTMEEVYCVVSAQLLRRVGYFIKPTLVVFCPSSDACVFFMSYKLAALRMSVWPPAHDTEEQSCVAISQPGEGLLDAV